MATSVGDITCSVETDFDDVILTQNAELNAKNALKAMADATLQRAQQLAPMSAIEGHAGTLRTTGLVSVEDGGFTVAVQFGEGIDYARYQEFGGDGKRVVRNYTTPGTQAHYLRDAGDSVAKEGIKNYL